MVDSLVIEGHILKGLVPAAHPQYGVDGVLHLEVPFSGVSWVLPLQVVG